MEPRGTRRLAEEPPARSEATVDDLRRLIVGPEQARLEKLEERPPIAADTVGKVLPEAVATATARRRDELAIALEPSLTTAIRTVARREAQLFGEVLSPTIGAAVRKAVTDWIAVVVQKFNEALERSLSWRSLLWRIEAKRTGQPFAEVVLLHTLVYHVEEVFLIHPRTGLVLERVAAPGKGVLEPDQVASMLEAIDRFVREAFATPGGVHVGRIEFGDLFLWVERSPDAAVAALVRGVAPEAFAGLLRSTRERISLAAGEELASFESSVAPFVAVRPLLERCLAEQRHPAPHRAHIWLVFALGLAMLAFGVFASRRHAHASEERHVLEASVAALTSQPGIVVTAADWADHRPRIRGLRDPLARAPEQVLAARDLPPANVELVPYSSLDPSIVELRARDKLAPPDGVSLELVGGVLHAHGIAESSWLESARRVAPMIPGVERYDESDLRSQQAAEEFTNASDTLERTQVIFPVASSDPSTARGLENARQRARQVVVAAAHARRAVCLSIVGHADPSGSEALNQTLSEARARSVATALVAREIRPELLRPVGAGASMNAGSEWRARSVTFRVDVNCGAR